MNTTIDTKRLARLEKLKLDHGAHALAASIVAKSAVSESGCWLWTASRNDRGYAKVTYRIGASRFTRKAHRVLWILLNGVTYGLQHLNGDRHSGFRPHELAHPLPEVTT